MSSKAQKEIPEWQCEKFSRDELKVARAQWNRCVEDRKIIFGQKPPITKNMKALCRAMAEADEDLKDHLEQPLVAGSKKYQALWDFVEHRCKPKK